MAKTLIVKLDDLSVVSSYDGAPDQNKYGGPWGDSNSHAHIALPDGMDVRFVTVDSDLVVTEEASDTAAREAQELAALRSVRDGKLVTCDWTQLADVDMGAGQIASWATYRQALRDITIIYDDLDSVVWPTEPPPEV